MWVHKKSRALIQVEGLDQEGRALRRFQVTHLMHVGDKHTLKRMRVDTLDPVRGKSLGVTYLEFEKPKAVAPKRGLQ